MRLETAMFLWMPRNEDIYGNDPRQGTVRVVARGDQDDRGLPMSAGACEVDWIDATDAGRFAQLQEIVSCMIFENGISREAILASLREIEDINPLRLDFDRRPD